MVIRDFIVLMLKNPVTDVFILHISDSSLICRLVFFLSPSPFSAAPRCYFHSNSFSDLIFSESLDKHSALLSREMCLRGIITRHVLRVKQARGVRKSVPVSTQM